MLLSKDADGDPKVTSKVGALHFQVYFYNCKNGRCAEIQFSKGFDVPDGVTVEKLNEWNRDFRFGRAFADKENDPWVQMDVDLERGGTIESVANNLETWIVIVETFAETLGWAGDADEPTT
ncbi:MAG: YbjN domain-containing protein [Alphaproteobacteria bacterium]|nr:YbjN domain-containing protein [Alphaproteobacteria bacterium]